MDAVKWQNIKNAMSAVLDLPASERADFLAREPDAEICAEVEKLLAAHEQAGGFIDKPILIERGIAEDETKDFLIGKQIENYLILGRIGTGGMGAVYLAERVNSDFKQKVALKLIKRGMDSEAILKRFARERRILSTLKHPNIAALLDGGIASAGLPFFVMELVDGKPLNEFCRENNLSLEKRLEIFRQICAAVDYAHKNLVIHRDLKPSNILVSEDGVPKLLDFGIAKLLTDDDLQTTATQAKMFTPEYASPEQILGKNVTTATDVYSLGVILYELLARHRPFETKGKSFEEIVKSICETEPPKPSETSENQNPTTENEAEKFQIPKNQLRGDLDNIVLKALRKELSERYGSVQQFSEDILRFLRGLPVLARSQTLKYRFGKYVKRHRAGVFAAALVLLSLVGGISVATWQAIVARRERTRAEQRFNDVRKLSNSFLFEFHDAIKNLSGATPARKLVIERALPFLDSLAEESADDDSLQSELAESYRKLGEIQGHPSFPNIGDVSGGIESFRKSIRIGENLVRRNPGNRDYRFNLVKYYGMLGDMFERATYDTPNALENYQTALRLCEELLNEDPADTNALDGLQAIYDRLGNIKAKTRELDAAIKDYQTSLTIAEQLQALEPAKYNRQRNVFLSYYEIGRALQDDGKYREALEQYAKGRTLITNLIAAEPNNTDLPRSLGLFDDLSANSHLQLGEMEAAAALSNKALAQREKLFAADPKNIQVYGDLTFSLDTAGDLRVKSSDIAGALKLLNRSLEMREAALKQDPTMKIAKRLIAISRNKIAAALIAQNDLPAALAQLNKALNLNRELSRDDSTNLDLRRELAVSLKGAGETTALIAAREQNPEKWREARDLLEESLKIYTDMKANNQFYGADREKVTSLNAFIKEYEQKFSR